MLDALLKFVIFEWPSMCRMGERLDSRRGGGQKNIDGNLLICVDKGEGKVAILRKR